MLYCHFNISTTSSSQEAKDHKYAFQHWPYLLVRHFLRFQVGGVTRFFTQLKGLTLELAYLGLPPS